MNALKVNSIFEKGHYVFYYRLWCTIFLLILVVGPATSQTISLVSDNGSVVYPEGSLKLSFANSDDYDTYRWYKDGGLISSATGASLNVKDPGRYEVEAFKRGKASRSTPFIVTFNPRNGNHIFTTSVEVPIQSGAAIDDLNVFQKNEQVQYFDGMDRQIQTIQIQGSGDATPRDIVNVMEYDELGRMTAVFLPYTSSEIDGRFQPYYSSNQPNFYNSTENYLIARDQKPYMKNVFEASPIGSLVEKGSAGAVWQPGGGKSINISEEANGANEVIKFQYQSASGEFTWLDSNLRPVYYAPNMLYRTRTTNENGVDQLTYTDKGNRILLRRSLSSGKTFDTYYIYDPAGRLVYVLPPEAIKSLRDSVK